MYSIQCNRNVLDIALLSQFTSDQNEREYQRHSETVSKWLPQGPQKGHTPTLS